jgi:hypothetical protein
MQQSAHSEIIALLGFGEQIDVRGRLSVADLFSQSKSRSGVYLLRFESGAYYIGQAIEVCRRFAQHRVSVGDIVGFAFMPVRQDTLDSTERALIQNAEMAGLPLTNRVHVSNLLGETDFDLVIPAPEQEAWLASWPRSSALGLAPVQIPLDAAPRVRTNQAFAKLRRDVRWPTVLTCLRTYAAACLPFAESTQLTFWSVSCLPSTNRSTWPRFCSINAGLMEMLVIGWEIDEPETWGFVNGARSVIEQEYGTIAAFKRRHRRLEVNESAAYRSAGGDQLQIRAGSLTELAEALEIPAVRNSAALLALRVMRTRATIYSKFHCPALADAMIAPIAF